MMNLIYNIDLSILMYIQEHLKTPFLNKTMPIITTLGNSGIIWIIICIILMFTKKYRNIGFMMALALVLTAFIGEIVLKNLVKRPRPFTIVSLVEILVKKPTSYSFPSGHSSASFAAATILLINWRKAGLYSLVLAVLIAFSRLYLFVHYPSDVLGGIILGTSCAFFVNYIFKRNKISRIHNND